TAVVAGAGTAALALGLARGFDALAALLPAVPDRIAWVPLLVTLLVLGVVVGCGLAAFFAVSDYRTGEPLAEILRTLPARVGIDIALAFAGVVFAGYWLGLAYLLFASVPAPYVSTFAVALAFSTVGGAFGLGLTVLARGWGVIESRLEGRTADLGLVVTLVNLLLFAALSWKWAPALILYQLWAVQIGGLTGLYLAAQVRRLPLGVPAMLCLVVAGHLPWRLNRFLRYAARRDLLRLEGRDYRFRHLLFAEHFRR
ncbi:MAG: hypothetical protein HOY71_26365, partial [Nonomuraea sp.]|nr:hypothetical protein [Nonomuraea sp.]